MKLCSAIQADFIGFRDHTPHDEESNRKEGLKHGSKESMGEPHPNLQSALPCHKHALNPTPHKP